MLPKYTFVVILMLLAVPPARTSGWLTQIDTLREVAVALTSDPNPAYVNQQVEYTVKLTASPTPTGTITFKEGKTVLATAALVNGQASFSKVYAKAGSFSIVANYSGDTNYETANSNTVVEVVKKYITSTTVTSGLNPSVYGQSVTLSATVTTGAPNGPTGTVTFRNGVVNLGTPRLNGNVATLTRRTLPAGRLAITAIYNGDSASSTSTSAVLTQVVDPATTTTTVTSELNPSQQGQSVHFVSKVQSPTVVPAGTVSFKAGSTNLGTVTLSGGKASVTTTTLPAGNTTVTATYNGTADITGSSAFLVQTVNSSPLGRIKHVLIIFQENRTPDNLFHDQVLIDRGADIASSGQISNGNTIPLTPVSLTTFYGLDHSHTAFLRAWNHGAMNGADKVGVFCVPGHTNCAPAHPQYQYINPSEVQPYFLLAETYTFGDRMFQTNQGASFAAHQYMISGTSAVAEHSTIFVSGIPTQTSTGTGCLGPPGAHVNVIDTANPDPYTAQTTTTQLCYEHPTLTDLLDAATLSWKYYTPTAGSIWTSPNAINHLCGPNVPPPDATACIAPEWTNHVVVEGPKNKILTDIAAGQLSNVSWVIPNGGASDHAGGTNGSGPSWVASIVNAIGTSQYWADTAIIITWDDWGGWYDHVPPPLVRNSYEYGLRVPLIVVSPYAKPAYISHVTHDFGSILKFVEATFKLPTIDPAVGYADSRSDDLSDCFDFNQTPLLFSTIPAPLDANYFLNDESPATPPDDD
jgi:phospholipase C